MAVRYKVGEVMVTNIIAANPSETVYDCARKMEHKNVGSLVIVDETTLAGILTDQDVTRKVVAKGLNPKTTPVSTIMSSNVHSIDPKKDIQEAIEFMADKMIKHLPVVENGVLVGIIAAKDIVALEPLLIEMLTLNHANAQRIKVKRETTTKREETIKEIPEEDLEDFAEEDPEQDEDTLNEKDLTEEGFDPEDVEGEPVGAL